LSHILQDSDPTSRHRLWLEGDLSTHLDRNYDQNHYFAADGRSRNYCSPRKHELEGPQKVLVSGAVGGRSLHAQGPRYCCISL